MILFLVFTTREGQVSDPKLALKPCIYLVTDVTLHLTLPSCLSRLFCFCLAAYFCSCLFALYSACLFAYFCLCLCLSFSTTNSWSCLRHVNMINCSRQVWGISRTNPSTHTTGTFSVLSVNICQWSTSCLYQNIFNISNSRRHFKIFVLPRERSYKYTLGFPKAKIIFESFSYHYFKFSQSVTVVLAKMRDGFQELSRFSRFIV